MSPRTPLPLARRAGAVLVAGVAFATLPAAAHAAVDLGTAGSFAVLGGQAVSNTGPSVITGDLGVNPGNAVTGFPPGTVNGAVHAGDAVAAQAQSDTTIAYDVAAGEAPTADLTGTDLGGLVLTPGVYRFAASAQLTGPLTLDAQGNPNAAFVFQVGSSLTTASASSVQLVNGAAPCNVTWQVGASATLGTDTQFVGDILALTSVTATTSADLIGRALARNGSVTLDTNTVTTPTCAPPAGGGAGGGGGERRRSRRLGRVRRAHHADGHRHPRRVLPARPQAPLARRAARDSAAPSRSSRRPAGRASRPARAPQRCARGRRAPRALARPARPASPPASRAA